MRKVVTVQANTVEDAVQQALDILELTRQQVHVEILTNPGRRLMGLRKVMAEIKVSGKESMAENKPIKRQLSKVEELAALLDGLDMEKLTHSTPKIEQSAVQEKSPVKSEQNISSARIQNGE